MLKAKRRYLEIYSDFRMKIIMQVLKLNYINNTYEMLS